MNTKNKYLIKNTTIFFISSFSTKILSFFLLPLYTDILSTKEYGIIDVLLTTITLLVYIFTLNIGDAVLRFSITEPNKGIFYLRAGIKIFLIGSLPCFFLVFLFGASNIFGINRAFYIFLFIIYLFTALYGLISNYSQGINKVIHVGIASFISSIVTILLNIFFLIVLDLRIEGYLLSQIIGLFASIIYLMLSLKISFANVFNSNFDEKNNYKMMIKYSFPLIFNGIAWWLNSAFDRYSILYLIDVDNTGVYSAASKIPLILSSVNSIFGQAWFLSVIKDVNKDDEDGFFSNSYNYYNLVLVCISSVLIAINIPLAGFILKKDFFYAWNYSSILIFSTIFSALSSFLGGAFSKTMNTGIFAKTTVISLIINICLNYLLISKFGTIGAAVATSFSFIVLWLLRFYYASKYVKIKASVLKHLFAYLILLIQIIIEHITCKFSLIQLVLVIIIFILFFKEIKYFSIKIIKKIRKQ